MFVIYLRFADRGRAAENLEAHRDWIRRGFEEGVFLLVGNLEPGAGGAILAHAASSEEVRRRVEQDPFVTANVVSPEIVEVTPTEVDDRLRFLLG